MMITLPARGRREPVRPGPLRGGTIAAGGGKGNRDVGRSDGWAGRPTLPRRAAGVATRAPTAYPAGAPRRNRDPEAPDVERHHPPRPAVALPGGPRPGRRLPPPDRHAAARRG